MAAHLSEGFFRVSQCKRHVTLIFNGLALEVGYGYAYAVASDFRSDKVSCGRVQAVDAWPASSVCALLSHVDKKAFLDQFAYKLGNCRDAGVQLLAQVGYAVVSLIDAKSYDVLLQYGVLAVNVA